MQTSEVGWQFRPESQDFTVNGVFDDQYMGMEGLPAKSLQRGLSRHRQQGGLGPETWPVDVIA